MKRSVKRLDIWLLPEDSKRERDDESIQWLCEALDNGTRLGVGWTFTKERWSEILRRRIAGRYSKRKSAPTEWRTRHFHIRHLITTGTDDLIAQRVAAIWTAEGHTVSAANIRTAATRKAARDRALQWIDENEKLMRRPSFNGESVPESRLVYKALDCAIIRIAKYLSPTKKVKTTTAT